MLGDASLTNLRTIIKGQHDAIETTRYLTRLRTSSQTVHIKMKTATFTRAFLFAAPADFLAEKSRRNFSAKFSGPFVYSWVSSEKSRTFKKKLGPLRVKLAPPQKMLGLFNRFLGSNQQLYRSNNWLSPTFSSQSLDNFLGFFDKYT